MRWREGKKKTKYKNKKEKGIKTMNEWRKGKKEEKEGNSDKLEKLGKADEINDRKTRKEI